MNNWPNWPFYGLENDLLQAAEACLARGERFALATLVRIEGSSPRPLGSEMLITSAGEVHGYVSGGCVEAAVAQQAMGCLADGRPRLLDYGQGSEIIDIQLTCGGRINVLVRPVDEPEWWISQLRQVRLARRPLYVSNELSSGRMQAVESCASADGRFVKRYEPPVRLVLVGSDPATLASAMLAGALGMEVVLWRPHGPSQPPPGLAVHAYLAAGVPEGLQMLALDAYTALYCLSHDLALDVRILQYALASEAFCVGVLGSRGKRTQRQQALRDAGVTEAQLARLNAPAGIAIGAKNPQEIALSILAQVVACRHDPGEAPAMFDTNRNRHAMA